MIWLRRILRLNTNSGTFPCRRTRQEHRNPPLPIRAYGLCECALSRGASRQCRRLHRPNARGRPKSVGGCAVTGLRYARNTGILHARDSCQAPRRFSARQHIAAAARVPLGVTSRPWLRSLYGPSTYARLGVQPREPIMLKNQIIMILYYCRF